MVRWKLRGGAIGFALATIVSSARANGRFPLANQVVADPKNPSHLVARTTFGILDTSDGGTTWTWICEDAVGYFGGVEDPPIAVTADGSTLVASSKGLAVSHDGGCSWTQTAGPDGHRAGVDITVDPMNPHQAVALESLFASGVYSVFLVRTDDDGTTWNDVGQLPANFLAETVEFAPSNPDRVYVSGRVNNAMQPSALLVSDDGGQTWTQRTMDVPGGASAYIGGVDPIAQDTVYLRVKVTMNTMGLVVMTPDAGMTWKQIWTGAGDVAGFALSGDGTTIAVGGPDSGVSVANNHDLAFTQVNTLGPSCLTFSGDELFACGKEAVDLFSIGVSTDKGLHFAPILHFPDIRPRNCAAGTSAAVCVDSWSSIAGTIGVDAGAADAAPEPAADAASSSNGEAQGGCSCATSSRKAFGSLGLFGLAALLIVGRRLNRVNRSELDDVRRHQ